MALCESSNRRMRWQKAVNNLFFFSNAGRTNSKALKPPGSQQEIRGPDTSTFEMQKRIHDRAYLSADSEKVCV